MVEKEYLIDWTKWRYPEMKNYGIIRVIFFVVLALLFGVCGWSILSGYISQPFRGILIALEIFVLLLVGFIVRTKLSMSKYKNMSMEEKVQRIKDPTYLDLRAFLRESLFPLNFKEQQEDIGTGLIAKYARNEFFVELGKDRRDEYYYFRVSSQLKAVGERDENSYQQPAFDFMIDNNAVNVDSFKEEVRAKLPQWLEEQNIK